MEGTTLIQGRYRLLERIGRGGMGEVWRARDESLGRRVAVKCLRAGRSRGGGLDDELHQRFRREARVAASLQHRGVTVVHDFGDSEGTPFLVMELLEGLNLSQLLKENDGDPLPVADIWDIAQQICEALAYTHGQDIVHRDLKPANVMRLTDGTVKICDFGIAHLNQEPGFTARTPNAGAAMGTPPYMSPEQISGRTVDERSDLYSMGCVLYELATGAPPFDLEDTWSILIGHTETEPTPLRVVRPGLPEELDRMVLALLAKEPHDRPQGASEVSDWIQRARLDTGPLVPSPRGGPQELLPGWALGIRAGLAPGRLPRGRTPEPSPLSARWTLPRPGLEPHAAVLGALPTPATVEERHALGLSLGHNGRWAEAGELHQQVAAERAAALGPDHPETLSSRYELGFALSRQGRHAAALTEFEQVAAARERHFGATHAEVLDALQESAYVLDGLGRHEEAHRTYTAVLAAREASAGPDDPETLRCRHNLAFNLSGLGRLEESCRLSHEVAAVRARVLGENHPDTLSTRYEAAYALGRLGRWEEALAMYGLVADARARALGPDHPDTLAARYETGISLGRLGRSEEALALYRELAAARSRAQGVGHPETLRARHGIGVNLGRLGQWEEALVEARAVTALRAGTMGPSDPDTLVSLREVAVALGWLSRWEEALTIYRQVAAARDRVLGATHPDALTSGNDEAHCLEQLGRHTEATAVYHRVAQIRRSART
ncbi:serine/threonine protein kinase [Streptomyces sp. P38-E01]|uniref:non-specific serine/threonine protein kinase n=1 Tax=Streptomyces tardus TaxID=2780544 RepID=A0A949JS00_9ACTN|nr:tetratricopeptide repeat protein [Streptomyces tardus]MBU7600166.1 serine/threonine protein kinase [Streptomyces tardus]